MNKRNRYSMKKRNKLNWQFIAITIVTFVLFTVMFFVQKTAQNNALANNNAKNNPIEQTAQSNDALQNSIPKLEKELKDLKLTFGTPSQFQAKTLKELVPQNKEKVIALTFDDGPWLPYTEQILDILQQNKIKATFFMVGNVVKEYPEVAKKVVNQGHAVANHTWHHWYHKMSPDVAKSEIEKTKDIIYKTTGATTTIFRPPGGFKDNGLVSYAHKTKHFVAMWSSDSMDFRRPSPDRLAKNALSNARPGGMILMHDGGGNRANTVKALPTIISSLRSQGYRFVTVPQLLDMKAKELGNQQLT
ncbi:MAG TPA: polysaccharide deacetylase family protein, partial [Allocoleopsis sp.]